MVTAILRSKVGNAGSTISSPASTKPFEVVFNEENNYTCEVPTEVAYVDAFGKKHVLMENWAQHLLETKPHIYELVSQETKPIVSQPSPKATKKTEKKNHEKVPSES